MRLWRFRQVVRHFGLINPLTSMLGFRLFVVLNTPTQAQQINLFNNRARQQKKEKTGIRADERYMLNACMLLQWSRPVRLPRVFHAAWYRARLLAASPCFPHRDSPSNWMQKDETDLCLNMHEEREYGLLVWMGHKFHALIGR